MNKLLLENTLETLDKCMSYMKGTLIIQPYVQTQDTINAIRKELETIPLAQPKQEPVMNREEVIMMAMDIGLDVSPQYTPKLVEALTRFAALVAAAKKGE